MIVYTTFRRVILESELFPGAGDIIITCYTPVEITDERIRESQEKLDKLYDLILVKESKLANENFLAKAPLEIIKKGYEALWILEEEYNDKKLLLDQWRQALANCLSDSADSFAVASKL